MYDVDEERKDALFVHSECLAIDLGVGSPLGTSIRLVKNLRVCTDHGICYKVHIQDAEQKGHRLR